MFFHGKVQSFQDDGFKVSLPAKCALQAGNIRHHQKPLTALVKVFNLFVRHVPMAAERTLFNQVSPPLSDCVDTLQNSIRGTIPYQSFFSGSVDYLRIRSVSIETSSSTDAQ